MKIQILISNKWVKSTHLVPRGGNCRTRCRKRCSPARVVVEIACAHCADLDEYLRLAERQRVLAAGEQLRVAAERTYSERRYTACRGDRAGAGVQCDADALRQLWDGGRQSSQVLGVWRSAHSTRHLRIWTLFEFVDGAHSEQLALRPVTSQRLHASCFAACATRHSREPAGRISST